MGGDHLTPDIGEVRAALERCRRPLSQARSIPPAAYTDSAVHTWERRAIFDAGWVGVGRSDRWPPGSIAPIQIGDAGVIIARDTEGNLCAMANTCRHRGAEVVVAAEQCSRFQCPFHGWTYGLDGRLVGAPHMQEADFDRDTHGLVSFRCAERFGFVFISLEQEPPPIDDELLGFDELHAPWPLAELVTVRRREFTVECNWKAFAEVFNEYYHLPLVHKDSIDASYKDPDARDDAPGSFASQFGSTDSTASLLDGAKLDALPTMQGLDGREASGVRYTWLFPTLVFALGVDCMWMYEVHPMGPHRTRCAQVIAFPPETVARSDFDDRVDNYYERCDVAISEDIAVLERQHRGLRSPAAQQGPFSHLEPSVAHFADWYAGRMLAIEPE